MSRANAVPARQAVSPAWACSRHRPRHRVWHLRVGSGSGPGRSVVQPFTTITDGVRFGAGNARGRSTRARQSRRSTVVTTSPCKTVGVVLRWFESITRHPRKRPLTRRYAGQGPLSRGLSAPRLLEPGSCPRLVWPQGRDLRVCGCRRGRGRAGPVRGVGSVRNPCGRVTLSVIPGPVFRSGRAADQWRALAAGGVGRDLKARNGRQRLSLTTSGTSAR